MCFSIHSEVNSGTEKMIEVQLQQETEHPLWFADHELRVGEYIPWTIAAILKAAC